MKKSFLMLGVAAMALASCTNEEVLNVAENRAIGFDAFTPHGTRAVSDMTGSGTETFKKFYVYGSYTTGADNTTTVFNGEEVAYTSAWGYSPAQYWQNGDYKFAAYSNGNSSLLSGVTYTHDAGLKIENYPVGTADLIYATATADVDDKATYSTPVGFTFNHILSKVKFTFDSSSFADNLKVTVSGLKIDNSKKTGTYNGTNWTYLSEEGAINYSTVDVNNSKYNTSGQDAIKPEECYVLPQSTEGLTASFTVTVTDALDAVVMEKSFTGVSLFVANNETWNAGFVYNYTAELTEDNINTDGQAKPIVFTGNVNKWEDNTSGDGNLDIDQQ